MLSRFWRWLAGALALLLPVMYLFGRKDQATRTKGKEAIKDVEAQDKGRKAVQSGRDSGLTPDERVQNNDGRWL